MKYKFKSASIGKSKFKYRFKRHENAKNAFPYSLNSEKLPNTVPSLVGPHHSLKSSKDFCVVEVLKRF